MAISLILCLSLFFGLFCPSSLYLSLGPHPYNSFPLHSEDSLLVSLSFCHWYMLRLSEFRRIFVSCSFVCPTASASLCWNCGHNGALKPWNANTAHIAWDSSLGLLSRTLKKSNNNKRGACFSLYCLYNVNVLPWLSGTIWTICSPRDWRKKKKEAFLNSGRKTMRYLVLAAVFM